MSNEPKAPVTVVSGEVIEESTTEEKRPNFLVRATQQIKTHPKTAIAVVGGVALVSAGAFLGRKSVTPDPVESAASDFFENEVEETDSDDSQSA